MKIGIIGTGKIGGALGKRWTKAGHQVLFGSRDPKKSAALAQTLGENASGGSYADAVRFGEVLLLSTPWTATREVLESLGSLNGKILIECTNNVTGDESGGSTTEQIARWAKGAKVVKAFNTIFYQILDADSAARQERPTVFIVGDDDAKAMVTPLVVDAGCEPLDAGPLSNARYLDALAQFIIHLGYGRGMGQHISYKLIRL
jgi:predicted dinucleotide-binding enzyme